MKILIVGAGIAGVTLGAALARRGIAFDLVERRDALTQTGAGVVLGPNVMAALGPLGLDAAVAARAAPISALTVLSERGAPLSRTPYAVEGYRYPGMAIHRAALHEVLVGALPAAPRLGVTVATTQVHADGVDVGFSDGSGERYDLVVGADGVRSALRDALTPDFATRYAGYTCWRVVVPRDDADAPVEVWGRGRRLGVVPLGEGRTYVFLTLNTPRATSAPFTDIEGFRRVWAALAGPANDVLARVESLDQVLHNDLEDGLAPRWWAPRKLLIGDAAHAVTPNMGQGAGLAIEDAACLADLLVAHGPGDATLARFEALRRPRAAWILTQSRRLGEMAQLENGWLRAARDWTLRATPDSVAAATIRRVVTDMPGVPIASGLATR